MSTSSEIRATLDHPVIDADGHTLEFMPAVREYLKDVAGGEVVSQLARGTPSRPPDAPRLVGGPGGEHPGPDDGDAPQTDV